METRGEATSSEPDRSPAEPRINLKQPGNLDMEARDLPLAWKRWKETISLYMELAMAGRDEKMKVKRSLYLISRDAREVYKTMQFTSDPAERTLAKVLKALDDHCNPKRNKTVERYKFFIRMQEPTEPVEKLITE